MVRQWSYWEKDLLSQPIDFLIIGGGFSGLFTAYFTKKKYPKAKIILMDRSPIPCGASTRNAGFACFGSISELLSDVEKIGYEKAYKLVEDRYLGLELLKSIVPFDEMEFKQEGGYELFQSNELFNLCKNQIPEINRNLQKLNREVFALTPVKSLGIHNNDISQCISTPYEAKLHPGKLWQYLYQSVIQMGVQFFGGIEVKHLSNSGSEVHVDLGDFGLRVPKVIVCTNALAPALLPQLDLIPQRGQIIVSQPFNKPIFKGNIHAEEGYYYARCTSDNRILIGGARNLDFEGEQTDVFDANIIITTALKSFAEKYLLNSQSFEIQHQWSGIMGFSKTGSKESLVGNFGNIYYSVRLGGMGVALAPLLSKKVINFL